MVRQVDCRWNHLVPSLYLMHDKLVNLGVFMTTGAGEVTNASREELHYA
jgi:hypothetical protein